MRWVTPNLPWLHCPCHSVFCKSVCVYILYVPMYVSSLIAKAKRGIWLPALCALKILESTEPVFYPVYVSV